VHGKVLTAPDDLDGAFQDGVVYTKAYRIEVLKDEDLPDDFCRFCRGAPETVGHLLTACKDLYWNLHKVHPNKVVYQLQLALQG